MIFMSMDYLRKILAGYLVRKSLFDKDLVSGVENSIKKYGKTYQLLEKYDKEAVSDPKDLVKPKVLQNYLRGV